jgi:hypothetical protein
MRCPQCHFEIYAWFIERSNSPDLRQARELLEELL